MHYFSAPNMEQKIFTFQGKIAGFRTFFRKSVPSLSPREHPYTTFNTFFGNSFLCVVKLFFLIFFADSQFDISKMDKNKCPK